jgi:hypothetical protein
MLVAEVGEDPCALLGIGGVDGGERQLERRDRAGSIARNGA